MDEMKEKEPGFLNVDIRRTQNGYVLTTSVRWQRFRSDEFGEEYSFETFNSLVAWLGTNLAGSPKVKP